MLEMNTYCCDVQLEHWVERKTVTVLAQNEKQAEKAFKYFIDRETEKYKRTA